jgi:hypothetical protein
MTDGPDLSYKSIWRPKRTFLTDRRIAMDSQKMAGVWGAIVAAVVLAVAFYYAPNSAVKPAPQKAELPQSALMHLRLQRQHFSLNRRW